MGKPYKINNPCFNCQKRATSCHAKCKEHEKFLFVKNVFRMVYQNGRNKAYGVYFNKTYLS